MSEVMACIVEEKSLCTCSDGPARGIDVQVYWLFRIVGFQEEELRYDVG